MSEALQNRANDDRAAKSRPLVSIAIVLLVVIGIYFVVDALPLDVLGDIRPKRIAWWSLPLIAALQIAFLLVAAEIWRRLVNLSTGTLISLWSSYLQIAMVTTGKYVPGKVWGFVARGGAMYGQNIPVHLSIFSSVVEQVLVVTGGLLIATVTALIALPDYWLVIATGGISLLVMAVVAASRIPSITRWLLRRRKIRQLPDTLSEFPIGAIVRFTLAYGMLWILSGLIFGSIYFSLFDAVPTGQSIAALTLANTAGIVLGFFAFFVPGGIGVREAVATFVLAGFFPVREALLAAVCYRAWMILIDGFNALLILGREAASRNSA